MDGEVMTREERLDWLCRLRGQLVYFDMPDHWRANFTHALSEEINDLQQEPCEDCISRAELLKAVDTWDKFGCDADTKLVPVKDCYVPYIHYDDVVKAIKGMPSIQPKLKTDEPMQVELEGDGYADGELVYDYGKCPKCGWDFEDGDKDWEEPYCCHCGQKLHWFESEDKK